MGQGRGPMGHDREPGRARAAGQRTRSGAPKRHWALRLCAGLLILLLGLAALHLGQRLAVMLHGVWSAQGWTPVPARLESWELRRSSALLSGAGTAVRRPMHEIHVRYVYTAGGRQHTGTRVGFAPVHDNVSGVWREQVAQRLQAAAEGGVLTVWVDPAQSDQAVVDRSLPVSSAVFSAALLLMPCGVATAYALGSVLRWSGRCGATGDAHNRRWLLPLWALLHGLPVPPILALAAPGSIGAGSAAVLVLLSLVGLAGLWGLVRAARHAPVP